MSGQWKLWARDWQPFYRPDIIPLAKASRKGQSVARLSAWTCSHRSNFESVWNQKRDDGEAFCSDAAHHQTGLGLDRVGPRPTHLWPQSAISAMSVCAEAESAQCFVVPLPNSIQFGNFSI